MSTRIPHLDVGSGRQAAALPGGAPEHDFRRAVQRRSACGDEASR